MVDDAGQQDVSQDVSQDLNQDLNRLVGEPRAAGGDTADVETLRVPSRQNRHPRP